MRIDDEEPLFDIDRTMEWAGWAIATALLVATAAVLI